MRISFCLFTFVIALLISNPVNAQVFEVYSGTETYHRFCASCHGPEAMGDGPVASALPVAVPDLSLLRERWGDQYRTRALRRIIDGRDAVIYHGTRYMPVWGYEFWVEEGADEAAQLRVDIIVANLIDYIESIQRQSDEDCDSCTGADD